MGKIVLEISASELPETIREKLDTVPAETVRLTIETASSELTPEQVKLVKKRKQQADAGGPFIGHDEIVKWLRSLGSDNEQPPPEVSVSTT